MMDNRPIIYAQSLGQLMGVHRSFTYEFKYLGPHGPTARTHNNPPKEVLNRAERWAHLLTQQVNIHLPTNIFDGDNWCTQITTLNVGIVHASTRFPRDVE